MCAAAWETGRGKREGKGGEGREGAGGSASVGVSRSLVSSDVHWMYIYVHWMYIYGD